MPPPRGVGTELGISIDGLGHYGFGVAFSLSERLARVLREAGADTMFGLPGGGPNLDVVGAALAEGMRFVLAHGETAAAIMASTYGRLTAQPTPVVVTRGPGAASVVNGAAQATLDRYPLVVIADTVPSSHATRVAHQQLDQPTMFAPVSKVTTAIGDLTADAALADGISKACEWPAGTVHFDFDPSSSASAPIDPPLAEPSAISTDALAQATTALEEAQRPIVIVGFEAALWGQSLADALERFGCPVLTTYQALGAVPTEGSQNAGLFTNGFMERPVLTAADLIILLGVDEVEPIPAPWDVDCPVVRLSTVTQTRPYFDIAIDAVAPVDDLLQLFKDQEHTWPADAASKLRVAARASLDPPESTSASFGPRQLVATAVENCPDGITTTVDAGAHFLAVMPSWSVAEPLRLLISNGLATMGFAVPAAIGAALARPGEPVLALTGDGGMSMVIAELETIARLQLPITVVVFNDAALSLIEIKQQAHHGGPRAVRYQPVDFAAIAQASGLAGTVVSTAQAFAEALREGWHAPRLIDARIDPSDYPHLIKATRG